MKWTPIIAIICITVLESIALCRGMDGALFGLALVAIAGLGGYELRQVVSKYRRVK